MTPVAALVDVSKRFGSTAALEGVDLRVEPGDVVALLGRNGAGKTTAIRVLLGLRRPDSGHALLFGLDPRRPEARRRCGVTPQETDLPETLRVHELLQFVRAHFARPAPADELLRRFALDRLAHRQAGGLSGGERRRLAVALAFAGDPELVFLDEPSSGLDRESRGSLWESIHGYAQRGRTVLLTTHDLAEAEALATRIVVLESGRLVLQGAVSEIAARAGLQQVRLRSQRLPALPGVEHVAANGKRSILFTRDADAVVRALVAADADLAELEVVPISLEQALDVEAAR